MANGARDWSGLGAGGLAGASNSYGAGGTVSSADVLDFLRRGSPGRTPEAEYPAGYLGTNNGSRREDRFLKSIRQMNQRAYTRGVHAGSKIDPGDYVWPDNWNPGRGVRSEMRGMKTSLASIAPERLVRGGKDLPPPPEALSPTIARQFGTFIPPYSY